MIEITRKWSRKPTIRISALARDGKGNSLETQDQTNLKILLVEDSITYIEFTKMVLEDEMPGEVAEQ